MKENKIFCLERISGKDVEKKVSMKHFQQWFIVAYM